MRVRFTLRSYKLFSWNANAQMFPLDNFTHTRFAPPKKTSYHDANSWMKLIRSFWLVRRHDDVIPRSANLIAASLSQAVSSMMCCGVNDATRIRETFNNVLGELFIVGFLNFRDKSSSSVDAITKPKLLIDSIENHRLSVWNQQISEGKSLSAVIVWLQLLRMFACYKTGHHKTIGSWCSWIQ